MSKFTDFAELKDAVGFSEVFKDAVSEKVSDALATYKAAVAQSMFNNEVQVDEARGKVTISFPDHGNFSGDDGHDELSKKHWWPSTAPRPKDFDKLTAPEHREREKYHDKKHAEADSGTRASTHHWELSNAHSQAAKRLEGSTRRPSLKARGGAKLKKEEVEQVDEAAKKKASEEE